MKRIAALSFLFVFAVSAAAFAESKPEAKGTAPQDKAMTFEKRKEAALDRIDKKMTVLQDMKSCVSAAKSQEEMDSCKKKFKDEKEGMMERGHKMMK